MQNKIIAPMVWMPAGIMQKKNKIGYGINKMV
jgi:hypothetical protein